jgi:hypothetical protein
MKHQIPISNSSKPEECPVCLSGEQDELLTQYCCGHYVHDACIIKTGKSKCPVCRQFIFLERKTLKKLKMTAVYRNLEQMHPLVIILNIQPEKSVTTRYGMNKLYQHDSDAIAKTINVMNQHVKHFISDLDSSLCMRFMCETLTHRMEQTTKIKEELQNYYTSIMQEMMKSILQDIRENDELVYIPLEVESHIDFRHEMVSDNNYLVPHHLKFYCKIKSDFKQDNTPNFGYIEIK